MARLRILFPLFVAALTAAAGCGSSSSSIEARPTTVTTSTSSPSTTTEPTKPLILFIGDSVTLQASDALRDRLDGTVEIVALTGGRTIDLVGRVEQASVNPHDVVVINLGTNDEACTANGGCEDGYAPTAAELAEQLAGISSRFPDACRIGVTITAQFNDPPMVNPSLARMVDDGDLAAVADWSQHRRANEPADDPWLIDFIGHLTDSGRQAMAEFLATEIDSTCG